MKRSYATIIAIFALMGVVNIASAQTAKDVGNTEVDKWVSATGRAAGTNQKAQDEAKAQALRNAVEQACGVFLTAQSKTQDYKATYDKIFANTVGYVVEQGEPRIENDGEITTVTIKVRVSTKKFEEDWAVIAHTKMQENNPRVIIVIAETTDEIACELLDESKSSATTKATVTGESTVSQEAMQKASITRDGEDYIWVDQYDRRWRFRGGTSATCISHQNVTAEEIAAATSHFTSTLNIKSESSSQTNRQVWKRIASNLDENGQVQAKIEEFFLDKGILLKDKNAAAKVNKRDLMLAMANDNMAEVAALGAKFDADVLIFGTASCKLGGQTEVKIGEQTVTMQQYNARLTIRAVRTDSAQLLVAKTFGPFTYPSTQKNGGEAEALAKLAKEAAPEVLKAVVEAWRKQVNVSRDISLTISGMDYNLWKKFETEAGKIKGVQSLNKREITEAIASIDVKYDFTTDNLADNLLKLKDVKLEVVEINANRIKFKVVK